MTWFVGLASLEISVLHGIFCLLMIAFPCLTLSFLLRNRTKLPDRNYVSRYGTLYQGIKVENRSTTIYTFIFLLRRLFFVCLVVFVEEKEYFKPMFFLQAQVIYLIYVGWTKPHDDRWYNFLEKLNEVGLICIAYIMFLQTAFMPDQVVKYQMCWAAIWLCVILYFFNFISMVFVFFRELRHAYRMYSVKRKFILQYSRKGMIEQNYFKSSRDTGPKSKLKAKKLEKLGSMSSRDDGSPRKGRRRRVRGDEKSLLVAKNDVDDVIDGAFEDNGTAGGSQKHTREFMRKLRDAETAHKLHQINEADGEDSDDGFGPVAGGPDGYNMVSNRSSHRAGMSSRDGGRGASALVSETPQDDFFQPGNDLNDENQMDDKSVSEAPTAKKSKKGKKKKKKKATQLAAIGEDMLDSPVQSADEGADNSKAQRQDNSNSKINDDAATNS